MPITITRRAFAAIVAGSVAVGALAGFFSDTLTFAFSNSRRIHFWVTQGEGVDSTTVKINRFFRIPEVPAGDDPETDPEYLEVFGFPIEPYARVTMGFQRIVLQGGTYRCYYEKQGTAYYKDYPSPPVPPCP